MNEMKRMMRIVGTALAAAIFLGSCSIGLSPDTTGPEEDLERLDAELNLTANSAVTAAEAQLEAAGGIGASTTYNFDSSVTPVAVEPGATETLPARTNFPYPGWTTDGSVLHIDDLDTYASDAGWDDSGYDWKSYLGSNNLFRVTATARPDEEGVYPEELVREVYYVASADDTFDGDDFIFDPQGWANSGYRDEYVAEYADGSTRSHWVMVPDGDSMYATFDINGSMDYDTATENIVTVDQDAAYSSAVLYTHDLNKTFNYWFWNDNDAVDPMVVGIRYYTEHLDGTEYVGTSLTLEYTYNTDPDRDRSLPSLLARTVIREEMRFVHDDRNGDGQFQTGEVGAATDHTLRLQTEINNTSGGDDLVYTSNGKQISDWSNRNAQDAQIRGVQRGTLPENYGNVAESFDTVITDFE